METLTMLGMGFAQLMDFNIIFLCLVGSIFGTLVGVLPGFGPAAALAVLLPTIYGRDPLSSLVLLAGIFSGSMFGGMITSINLNVPGENAAIVTTFDGYPLAKQGKAGVAMGIAAVSSFFGGSIGLILLTVIGTPLASAALAFGPPEYFAIYLFTFIAILSLTDAGFLKSAISLFIGLIAALIGVDVMTGAPRLTFGTVTLMAGIDFLPAAVGLLGLSEIILNLVEEDHIEVKKGVRFRFSEVFPKMKDIVTCLPSMIRGSIVGFCVGALPGAGATIATFMTYSLEKRIAKDGDTFGKGNIKGVAAPESANNGSVIGTFVPLLSLGIPGSATSAILLGAFMMLGIQPGPRLFTEYPEMAWGLIASMYLGNIMLLFINTGFITMFLWLLRVAQRVMPVVVATLCFIGTYSVANSIFDIFLMLIFAGMGVLFKKLKIPPAPAVIALVLGGSLEFSFRQTMELFRGDFSRVFYRPLTSVIFLLCAALIVIAARKSYKNHLANKVKDNK